MVNFIKRFGHNTKGNAEKELQNSKRKPITAKNTSVLAKGMIPTHQHSGYVVDPSGINPVSFLHKRDAQGKSISQELKGIRR